MRKALHEDLQLFPFLAGSFDFFINFNKGRQSFEDFGVFLLLKPDEF
jgi:hypothetical protein